MWLISIKKFKMTTNVPNCEICALVCILFFSSFSVMPRVKSFHFMKWMLMDETYIQFKGINAFKLIYEFSSCHFSTWTHHMHPYNWIPNFCFVFIISRMRHIKMTRNVNWNTVVYNIAMKKTLDLYLYKAFQLNRNWE